MTREQNEDVKKLLRLMGVPVVEVRTNAEKIRSPEAVMSLRAIRPRARLKPRVQP